MITGNADALDVALMVIAGILALAALPAVHRMIVGPTILDRAVASDMLIVLVVAGMALYTSATGTGYAVAPMLGLTALAFVGTLAVARFVSRDRVRSGVARPPEDPDALQSDTLASDPPSAEAAASENEDAEAAVEVAEDAGAADAATGGSAPEGGEEAPAVRAPFTDDGPGPRSPGHRAGPHAVAGGEAPRLPGPAAGSHASGADTHESDPPAPGTGGGADEAGGEGR
jgi:multicomponent Na+:H+ antiporter subunit F